jgi:hypothetical protein
MQVLMTKIAVARDFSEDPANSQVSREHAFESIYSTHTLGYKDPAYRNQGSHL